MRILQIGCLHGRLPTGLKQVCKKEKIDVILSHGDFSYSKTYRKLFFKYAYRSEEGLEKFIGEERTNKLRKQSNDAGERVIKSLNSIGLPVITITGNWDQAGWMDIQEGANWQGEEDVFTPMLKKYKNFKCIDFKTVNFGGFTIIGYPRSSWPGKTRGKNNPKLLKIFDRHLNRMAKLFEKAKKKKANIIFLSHNAPYWTDLDIVSMKAVKLVRGKHMGSLVVKKLIQKYHPQMCLTGHIHEGKGKDNIGSTTVVNSGAMGHYAIIDVEPKKKPKIKFGKL